MGFSQPKGLYMNYKNFPKIKHNPKAAMVVQSETLTDLVALALGGSGGTGGSTAENMRITVVFL